MGGQDHLKGKIIRIGHMGYIVNGDIIQVVGSQRFSATTKASPMDVYRAARSICSNDAVGLFVPDVHLVIVGASRDGLDSPIDLAARVRAQRSRRNAQPVAGIETTPEEARP